MLSSNINIPREKEIIAELRNYVLKYYIKRYTSDTEDYIRLAKEMTIEIFEQTAVVSLKVDGRFCHLYVLNASPLINNNDLWNSLSKFIDKKYALTLTCGIYNVDGYDQGVGVYAETVPVLKNLTGHPKKSVYLSGPISVDKEGHKKHFKTVEKILKALGWDVINPADDKYEKAVLTTNIKDRWGPETWLRFIKRDMDLVSECDAICMLSDWEKSPGANIEFITAKKFDLEIIYEEDLID